MRRRLSALWLGAALFGVMLFACEVVWARAGGGGGFSSGGGGFSGGSGYSGGGGGNGGGVLIYLLFRLCVEHPLIGIPLLVGVAYFLYVSSKGAQSAHVARTIRRGVAAWRTLHAGSALPAIRQRDPAFDLDAFLARCSARLPPVQEAWSQQDMTPVRHFLSDGVFDRFSLQLEMQKGSGVRNEMRDVRVLRAWLVGSSSDAFFDTLHVAITAEAADTTVALADGRGLQGNGQPEPFTEVWTFLRRPGAKTLARPGLMEGYCPNCGTPLALSTSITCGSCQALINSGEYDWVLSEITQAEVWSAPEPARIRGVAELCGRDPGFNAQAIEDRVSAIFWRYRAAEFFGDAAYVRSVALPEFVGRESKAWQPDGQGRHPFYADAAVGSVDLAEVMSGEGTDGMDRVRVRVQWSGHREIRKVPGLFAPEWAKSRLMAQEYVLVRKCGVQSLRSAALTSLHCPGCGAPQVAKQDGSCRYCGQPQNDGSSSWVLEAITAFGGFAAVRHPASPVQALSGTLPLRVREAMIQSVAAVMLADSVIDPREERMLRQMAAKQGIAAERLGQLIEQARQGGEGELPPFEQWDHRRAFFSALIRMCLADGNVSAAERHLLRTMIGRLGYSEVDIDPMIARERADLYEASKAALKANDQRRKS